GEAEEKMVVVEPGGLVVNASHLGEGRLGQRAQIQNGEAPGTDASGLARLLEGDPSFVRRKRRTLYVLVDHARRARRHVAFDQVGNATRGEGSVEAAAVAVKGDSPKIEVRILEWLAISRDRKLLE